MNEIEKTFTSYLAEDCRAYAALGGNFYREFLEDETAKLIWDVCDKLKTYDLIALRKELDGKMDLQTLMEIWALQPIYNEMVFKCYALEIVKGWKNRKKQQIVAKEGNSAESLAKVLKIENFELYPPKKDDVSQKFLADAELVYQGVENPRVIWTGFTSLDRLIGGFERGELITLGGYSGGGKTTLALNIATNVAESGKKVLYFSLEMSALEMHKRRVCTATGVSLSSQMSEKEFTKLIETSRKLDALPLEIVDDTDIDDDKIAARCMNEKNLGLVVVDHLHILRAKQPFKTQYDLLTYLSRRMKVLAQELNVPVLLLSQMNRGNVSREIKEPTMSDLRGSGSIEQDSNLVIFVYTAENLLKFQEPKEGTKKHQEWEEELERKKGKAQISVVKNRRGQIGKFTVKFLKEQSKFVDNGGGEYGEF